MKLGDASDERVSGGSENIDIGQEELWLSEPPLPVHCVRREGESQARVHPDATSCFLMFRFQILPTHFKVSRQWSE